MKSTKIMAGCALAVGLMSFASTNVQAGIVVNNQLLAPATFKATITYESENDNGKVTFKKMSFNNKDILSAAGLDIKGAKLVANPDSFDVLVVTKESGEYVVVRNLSDYEPEDGCIVSVYVDPYISSYKEKSNGYKSSYQGSLEVYVQTDFYYNSDGEDYGYDYSGIDLYGVFSANYSWTENNKNASESFSGKGNNLSGSAYEYDWYSNYYFDEMPATGKVSASGSGKIQYVD